MFQLVEAHPQCFWGQLAGSGVSLFKGYAGEDWYRAYILAVCALRLVSKAITTTASSSKYPVCVFDEEVFKT